MNSRTPVHLQPERTFGNRPQPEGIVAADINHDGWRDILVANSKSQSISLLLNGRNGQFGGQIQFAVPDEPSAISLIPKNDSTAIVLSTNPDSEKISILEINLQHYSHTTYTLPTQGNTDIVFVHLNPVTQFLSLYAFIVEKISSQKSLLAFEQITSSRFIERIIPLQNIQAVQSLTMGDFNGDGIPDIVYCSADLQTHTENLFQSVGNSSGTFDLPKRFYSFPLVDTASIRFWHCDLNNDGIDDLVCNDRGSKNLLYVFLGRKDSTLIPAKAQLQSFISVDRQDRLKFIDMNGDGIKDIVLENHFNKTIEVYLNHGDGTFALPYRLVSSEGIGGFDIANLGGDANPDLIVTDAAKGLLKIISLK